MRYEDELTTPRYVKINSHKSFVYLASKEYNEINRYIKENKLSTNNYIINVKALNKAKMALNWKKKYTLDQHIPCNASYSIKYIFICVFDMSMICIAKMIYSQHNQLWSKSTIAKFYRNNFRSAWKTSQHRYFPNLWCDVWKVSVVINENNFEWTWMKRALRWCT